MDWSFCFPALLQSVHSGRTLGSRVAVCPYMLPILYRQAQCIGCAYVIGLHATLYDTVTLLIYNMTVRVLPMGCCML